MGKKEDDARLDFWWNCTIDSITQWKRKRNIWAEIKNTVRKQNIPLQRYQKIVGWHVL